MLIPAAIAELRAAGDEGIITLKGPLQTHECDVLTHLRALPGAVVLPRSVR